MLHERRLACDSAEGRLICDEIAPTAEMDAAIDRVVDGLTSAGAVSAIGNRRAFRVGQELLDLFRVTPPLRQRAGLLPLQPRAHRKPRAQLGRPKQKDLIGECQTMPVEECDVGRRFGVQTLNRVSSFE